jgi:hypothetical protein
MITTRRRFYEPLKGKTLRFGCVLGAWSLVELTAEPGDE